MAKKPEPEAGTFVDMFSRLGRDLRMPQVDVEMILEHHRKNLEALQKSASATAAGATGVFAKQQQLLEQTLHEVSDIARDFRPTGNPQEIMAKQAEFARKSFETAVKNVGEVAGIIARSGNESAEILRQRIRDSMEEIRQAYEKQK